MLATHIYASAVFLGNEPGAEIALQCIQDLQSER